MTHELKEILEAYVLAVKRGEKCVVASVVDLDGSSYRRPGVRMLVTNSGELTGAVSGGCVEKDILRQAFTVFESGRPRMMTYEGKYKLGCEGTIYILLEPFHPGDGFVSAFKTSIDKRETFELQSFYSKDVGTSNVLGSQLIYNKLKFPFNKDVDVKVENTDAELIFTQELEPMFQLIIFGAEHDSAKLSEQASLLGWQVRVVTSAMDSCALNDFPGSDYVSHFVPEQLPRYKIDDDTAVVLMTHNYAKDLNYFLEIENAQPCYLGLLGPVKRRNKLLDEVLERKGTLNDAILDVLHGPAGLNLGSETAEEIALSICSEIIAVRRNKDASKLRNQKAAIHSSN